MGNSSGVISGKDQQGLQGFIQRQKNKSFNAKKIRYMGGKTFIKFFREDAWPLHEETFERLNINESRGYELFRIFAIIDQNENGKICLNEIFQYLKFPRTKLTERLFDFSVQETRELEDFHNFSKKELDFREFALRIWNFCTLRHDGLARYLFEIFDINETFFLSKNHIITMYHMLYNTNSEDIPVINRLIGASDRNTQSTSHSVMVNHNNIELLKQILSAYQFLYDEKLHYYVIMKESFIETSTKTTYLIDPIVSYQKLLQKKIGGIIFWHTLTQYRYTHPLIKSFDFKSNTLQDSLDSIVNPEEEGFLNAKRRRANQTAEALLRTKSEKLRTDREMIASELSSREKELELDIQKASQNSFMQRMEKKWALFRRAKEHFLHEEFTIEDAWRRREMRLKLYDFLDHAISASRDFYEWKDKRDIEITEGTDLDHETRCHDFITNSLIQQHYDPRQQQGSVSSIGNGNGNGGHGGGNVMDAEEAVFHEIVMNNGKFIYGLLSLIKLYDIVLANLQQEMDNDPRKQSDPIYKEKVLTVTNTLNQLQQNYHHFRLLSPEDHAQQNPTLPEYRLNPAVVVIDPFHPNALALMAPTEENMNKASSHHKKEDSLEAVLQKNEKQKQMKQLLSQMFIEERNLIRRYEKKTDDLLAQKQARDELLVELKEKMLKMCYRSIAKLQLQREQQYWKEEFDLMQNIGSRITRWEYVLEKNENKFYYLNIDTMELKHPKTAICEYCDAFIVQNELKCDQCMRMRSPKNKLLYRPLGYKDITLE